MEDLQAVSLMKISRCTEVGCLDAEHGYAALPTDTKILR